MLNYFLCTRNPFLYKVDFLSCFYDLLLYFLDQGLFKGISLYSGIIIRIMIIIIKMKNCR